MWSREYPWSYPWYHPWHYPWRYPWHFSPKAFVGIDTWQLSVLTNCTGTSLASVAVIPRPSPPLHPLHVLHCVLTPAHEIHVSWYQYSLIKSRMVKVSVHTRWLLYQAHLPPCLLSFHPTHFHPSTRPHLRRTRNRVPNRAVIVSHFPRYHAPPVKHVAMCELYTKRSRNRFGP